MQLPSASRPTRVRRLLAISAAAVAVMIAPTACDYGGYGGSSHDIGDMGNMPGMDHGKDPNAPVVVPVGNTVESTPAPSSTQSRRHRHGRRGHGQQTTTATATPIGSTTTDTAAPPATDTATDTAVPPVTDTTTAAPVAGEGDRGPTLPPGGDPAKGPNNGIEILGRDCNADPPADEAGRTKSQKDLPLHNGFQSDGGSGDPKAGKGVAQCVNTEMGAVAAENQLPSLLIVDNPTSVGINQAFTIKVSTRNLVRDRFLGAAAGGYYLESSFLNKDGLQRGHFHTACRILPSIAEAPDSGKPPEFFLATEDGGGGAAPDVVTINVPATSNTIPGDLQCTSWAGDGSHRTPMMTRANETPAIDSVRITVTNDNAPPTGYRQAAGNDPAAAAADAAKQADVKEGAAADQQPDAEVNGNTDSNADAPATPAAPAADTAAPADTPAPADTASDTPAADAPATN